jgi:hypothetical protein
VLPHGHYAEASPQRHPTGARWKTPENIPRFSALFHFFPPWKARISAISANFRPPSPIGMGYGAPRGEDSMENEKMKNEKFGLLSQEAFAFPWLHGTSRRAKECGYGIGTC